MTDLVIYGLGPFARLMHYYFTHDSKYRVAAFTADPEYVSGESFCGLPVIPLDGAASAFPPRGAEMFVAIGYRRMRSRMPMFARAKGLGYRLANYISSQAAWHAGVAIGENNVAMAGTVFEPFAAVGDHNVFWSGTLTCHDISIGHGNYFAASCVLAGNCKIGNGCFFGNRATLINDLEIADETQVLPGSTLFQSTRACRKYQGNPARDIGGHESTGIVIERG